MVFSMSQGRYSSFECRPGYQILDFAYASSPSFLLLCEFDKIRGSPSAGDAMFLEKIHGRLQIISSFAYCSFMFHTRFSSKKRIFLSVWVFYWLLWQKEARWLGNKTTQQATTNLSHLESFYWPIKSFCSKGQNFLKSILVMAEMILACFRYVQLPLLCAAWLGPRGVTTL